MAKQICKRCVLDESVPGVSFDSEGICSHCRMHDSLDSKYQLNEENNKKFEKLLNKIKRKGKNNKYDCLIGLSGGIDSTYCLYLAKKLGLRPLAFHFDNGWVADIARENINNAVQKLDVELRIVRPDWEELRKYQRACLDASVPETSLACEVGIASNSFKIAAEENIKYILLGTSFRTEGINPLRWHYVDGEYFNDIMRKFGKSDTVAAGKKFNQLTLLKLFYYIVIKGIRTFQLPLYVEYKDNFIMPLIEKELGWKFGGREHFDCDYKPFAAYIDAKKSVRDLKRVSLSALVRSNEMTREEALEKIKALEATTISLKDIDSCMKRLELTPEDLEKILAAPPKTFLDFKTQYQLVSKLKVPIKVCGKLNLIPETMYEKLFF